MYFSIAGINQDDLECADVVAKGTDCGGAIEVFENEEDALIRCEYLSQFDNTLMYSGSFAIIGTMVIMTSYILLNEQQTELTSKITEIVTVLK